MSAQRQSRITPLDIRAIAFTLVDRHGDQALNYADLAVTELEEKGEDESANAWRVLRWEIQDALAGVIGRESPIQMQ
ncbi:hypothetical protein [Oceanicaulis sp.]|jgi:hypothetical protein|uniref:hypothetical protein n=1 Tax=Oceanicaulis sp. TaxID=1924941 RepID=UPI003F6EBF4C